MKFLLLGKNGQLGWELQRALSPLGEVHAPGRHEGGDLSQVGELTDMAYASGAQVIVNAAAYTAVDKAEDAAEQDRCMDINAGAPNRGPAGPLQQRLRIRRQRRRTAR